MYENYERVKQSYLNLKSWALVALKCINKEIKLVSHSGIFFNESAIISASC